MNPTDFPSQRLITAHQPGVLLRTSEAKEAGTVLRRAAGPPLSKSAFASRDSY
jgi:hypothetical protein